MTEATEKTGGMAGHESTVMGKDEWLTPKFITDALGAPFDLDPCSPVVPPWPIASRTFTAADDGLKQDWGSPLVRVWCNPPYGPHTGAWLQKCAMHGNALALVFARTETVAWQQFVFPHAHALLFLRGRLTFCNVDGSPGKMNAGAPSALIAYGNPNAIALEPLRSGLAGAYVRLRA